MAAVLVMTVACSGSGRSHDAAQIFVNNLNNHDPGGHYYLVKEHTIHGGNSIIVVGEGSGRTYAVDINSGHRYDYSYDIDYYNHSSWRVFNDGFLGGETVFADSSGYLYTDKEGNKYSLYDPKNLRQSKIMAEYEKMRLGYIADSFQKEFGFSAERSGDLAEMYVATDSMIKKGSLTSSYVDGLGKDLIGMSFDKAQKIMTSGNGAEKENLLKTAAKVNGRSVKQASALMTKLFTMNGMNGML